jgi:hypothetical protein
MQPLWFAHSGLNIICIIIITYYIMLTVHHCMWGSNLNHLEKSTATVLGNYYK